MYSLSLSLAGLFSLALKTVVEAGRRRCMYTADCVLIFVLISEYKKTGNKKILYFSEKKSFVNLIAWFIYRELPSYLQLFFVIIIILPTTENHNRSSECLED